MQILSKRKIVSEFGNGDYASMTIYENFIVFQVFLNQDTIYELMEAGGVPLERKGLNTFLKKILNESFEGLMIFSTVEEFNKWKNKVLFEVPDYENGVWSHSAIFIINQEKDFETELERIILFIKDKCAKYQMITIKGKESIAKKITNKYF